MSTTRSLVPDVRLATLLLLLIGGPAPARAGGTLPAVGLTRALSATTASPGQSVTVTLEVKVGDIGGSPLRGFYLSEPVPSPLEVSGATVTLGGTGLPIQAESASSTPGSTTRRWVLEEPPSWSQNHPLPAGSVLQVSYALVIPAGAPSGPLSFPGASWVGMIAAKGDAGDHFGYEDSVTTLTITGGSPGGQLLFDDFADGNDMADPPWSQWSCSFAVSAESYHQASLDDNCFSVAGEASWTDYTVELEVKLAGKGQKGSGPMFRVADQQNLYLFEVSAGSTAADLWRYAAGSWTQLATGELGAPLAADSWHKLKVVLQGPTIQAFVDDQPVVQANDGTIPAGRVGVNSGDEAWFDTVRVTAPWTPPSGDSGVPGVSGDGGKPGVSGDGGVGNGNSNDGPSLSSGCALAAHPTHPTPSPGLLLALALLLLTGRRRGWRSGRR